MKIIEPKVELWQHGTTGKPYPNCVIIANSKREAANIINGYKRRK